MGDAFDQFLLEVAVPCVAVGVRGDPGFIGKIARAIGDSRIDPNGTLRCAHTDRHTWARLVDELIIDLEVIGDHVHAQHPPARSARTRNKCRRSAERADPPAAGIRAHGIEQQLIGGQIVLQGA